MKSSTSIMSFKMSSPLRHTRLVYNIGRHHTHRTAFKPSAGLMRPADGRASHPLLETDKEHRGLDNLILSPESTSYEEPADVAGPQYRFKKLWKTMLKSAAAGALCLALVVAAANPALAARSGGRVGGSAFSSGRSMSGPSISRSYGSAGAGMGGSMLGGSMASPSLRGYSRSQSSVQGSSFGFFGPPAPWGVGGYGYGYGAPVQQGGGFGLGGILLFGILAAVLFSVFSSSDGDFGDDVDEAVTVVKLQVGLLSSARQLKQDLERITKRADTTSPDGLHYILQETVLALLRNPDYAVYGSATTSKQRGPEKAESKFNRLSMEERGKFKEETLSNYDGRSRKSSYSGGGNGSSRGPGDDLIVITIIAAINGRIDLPKVTSGAELRDALNTLGSVGTEQVYATEVLWTPQDENDYYTRDDIIHDYPTLNNL